MLSLEPYANAELYVAERTPLGFVVQLRAGDPTAEFSYRVVRGWRGYETTRLEPAPWADRSVGSGDPLRGARTSPNGFSSPASFMVSPVWP